MSRAALLALLLVNWPAPGHAASPHLRFEHLTARDGLSHTWVPAILKDSGGFLWFGTQDGLNRYDGSSIKVYRNDPKDPGSLPSSVATVLVEDSRRRLWVGSGWGNRGVARYDRELDRFESFLPNPGQSDGNNVRAILEDRQGQLWLGTDNGVASLDPEARTIHRFPLVEEQRSGTDEAIVGSLFEDRQGQLWVGSAAGLLRFDRASGRYSRWPGPREDATALSGAEICDFWEEDAGALWVATLGGGLYRLEVNGRTTRYLPDPEDPQSISHARVRRLVPDGKGGLYVGTENGGLNLLDLATRRFTRFSADPDDPTALGSNSIWSLHLDDQGILWIGTYDGGVDRVSPFGQAFRRITARGAGLGNAQVSAVLEDRQGNVWIGTNGGGLSRRDGKTGAFTRYAHDPRDPTTLGSDAIWALFEDAGGRLWVGGWDSGLGLLDARSGRVTRFRHDPQDPRSIASDHIWRILELSSVELLVITHVGADLFDREKRVFTRLSQRYPGVEEGVLYSGAQESGGHIWLAGIGPVWRIERETGRVTAQPRHPRDPRQPGSGWTEAVLIDSAGNVWLGSDGGLTGIAVGGAEMRHYTTADGLPANAVNSLAEDGGGSLWIGTHRGLSQLAGAVRLPERPVFLNFDVYDGLHGNEFARNAAFRTRSGELLFGGAGGVSAFDPADIRRNPDAPPVVLTDLRVFNQSVPIGPPGSPLSQAITRTSELTLSHRHAMVTFEFAALNFVLPQKNRYAYKLEGFDREWNEVGAQRTATYTNLPHGRFTLRVRASNNDGVWNHEGASLQLRVTPPFWKAGWFLALLLLTLVSVAIGLHRLRLHRHVLAQRALEARVAEALTQIKTLRGLLPICAWCKKVRDDTGYWNRIEEYVSKRTEAEFSHGICPQCSAEQKPPGRAAAGDA
jgi:ligand-binding sensor domain-containing protein